MKQYIKEYFDETLHDGFSFSLDDKDNLEILSFTNKDSAPPIEVSKLGFKYHILLYQELTDNSYINVDLFEGIIGDPIHYISELIKSGWLGLICKKTETSSDAINLIYDKLLENVVVENT